VARKGAGQRPVQPRPHQLNLMRRGRHGWFPREKEDGQPWKLEQGQGPARHEGVVQGLCMHTANA
jgi:hypothetical protein